MTGIFLNMSLSTLSVSGNNALFTNQNANDESVDVSVVIPTFHREQLVSQAIQSALRQVGVQLEVIVVDDAPEATARPVVESIKDSRLRYFSRPEPSGGRPACARNDGGRLARGRYIHFLDDDDMLEPGILKVLVEALDSRPDAGMAFGQITPFGEDASKLKKHAAFFRRAAIRAARISGPCLLAASLVYSPSVLINSACIARRSVFETIGGFDESIPVCEDADLWARMALASNFIFIQKSIVQYRTGAFSIMNDMPSDDKRMLESYQRIQAKFVARVGAFTALCLKFWCRTVLKP